MSVTHQPIRHVEVPDRLRSLKRRTPPPVKRAARGAARRWGEATAPASAVRMSGQIARTDALQPPPRKRRSHDPSEARGP